MAIEVKHGSGASEIAGAFAASAATAQEKQQQQMMSMLVDNQQAEQQRQFQAGQNALNRQWQRDNVEFEISAKQRAEFNRLSDAYESAVSSGNYSPEELEQLKRDIDAKQMGIEPRPRMNTKSRWPGKEAGDTWISDDGYHIMSRKPDGTPFKIGDTGKPSNADMISAYKAFSDAYKNDENIVDEDKVNHMMRQQFPDLWNIGAPSAMPGAGVAANDGQFKEVVYDGTESGQSDNDGDGATGLKDVGSLAAEAAREGIGLINNAGNKKTSNANSIIESRKKEIIAAEGDIKKQMDIWENNQEKKKDYISEGTNFSASPFSASPSQGAKFSDPAVEEKKDIDFSGELKSFWDSLDMTTAPERAKKLIKEKKYELLEKLIESNNKDENKKIALAIKVLEKLEE